MHDGWLLKFSRPYFFPCHRYPPLRYNMTVGRGIRVSARAVPSAWRKHVSLTLRPVRRDHKQSYLYDLYGKYELHDKIPPPKAPFFAVKSFVCATLHITPLFVQTCDKFPPKPLILHGGEGGGGGGVPGLGTDRAYSRENRPGGRLASPSRPEGPVPTPSRPPWRPASRSSSSASRPPSRG